jgi:hypothetical protein
MSIDELVGVGGAARLKPEWERDLEKHTFSAPVPNNSLKVPAIRVFLPAPLGP